MRWLKMLTVTMIATVAAWSADPFLGEWKINPTKSQSTGPTGQQPISDTLVFEPEGDDLQYTINQTYPDGRVRRQVIHVKRDGKEYPAESRPGTTISRKRISENSFEATFRKDNKEIQRDLWTVSPDGKTLMFTGSRVSQDGKMTSIKRVFDRQ